MSTSTLHSTSFDSVIIRDLRCHATIGNDRWGKAAPQPIRVTVHLETALARTGHSDNIHEAINYSDLFRELMSLVNGGVFDNLRALAETVVQYALNKLGVRAVKVDAEALNQFLLADALVVTLYRDNGQGTSPLEDRICIRDLRLNAIIGTSQPERECRQPVITSLTFNDPSWVRPNWHEMQNAIVKAIEESSYYTIEAFATNVARVACHLPGASVVTVRAYKPAALAFAGSSGVEITRDRTFFINMDLSILHSLQIDSSYSSPLQPQQHQPPPPPTSLAAAADATSSAVLHHSSTESLLSSPITSPVSPTLSLQASVATPNSTSPLLTRRVHLHHAINSFSSAAPIMINHM